MAEIKTLATCKEIDDYLDYYDGLLVACFWKEPDLYKVNVWGMPSHLLWNNSDDIPSIADE